MAFDVIDEESDELLLTVGGRWDRRKKHYIPAAKRRGIEVKCHPAQTESVEWFDGWLDRKLNNKPLPSAERMYSMILSGGQRGGKTFVGVSVFPIAYTLAIPGHISWIVCPSKDDFEEVEDYLENLLPKSWYTKRSFKSTRRYNLANGSRIVLRSGHNAESLKKGRCDLIVINEAQQMKEKVLSICRARIADQGGLVIGCANPPDTPKGEWVGDWVVEADAGERQAIHFYFDPFRNPHIDHDALRAQAKEMDPRTYEIEVLGLFLSVGDVVLYNWDRRENEVSLEMLAERLGVKQLRDITALVTKEREGAEFDRVLGVDVQRNPMASIELKFFENPKCPVGSDGDAWWKYAITVITDEVVIDDADEFDLTVGWSEKEWDPEKTLLVCDASAKWQFGERDPMKVAKLREEVKGKGSWAVFRKAGYRHIRNPDRKMKKNPDVVERCRATTSRIKTKQAGEFGQRFFFSLPKNKRTNRAIRGWPNLHGRPSRTSRHAHLGDCVTYPMQRFYERRERSDHKVKIIKARTRRRDMRGY